jgi:hypothetical protein
MIAGPSVGSPSAPAENDGGATTLGASAGFAVRERVRLRGFAGSSAVAAGSGAFAAAVFFTAAFFLAGADGTAGADDTGGADAAGDADGIEPTWPGRISGASSAPAAPRPRPRPRRARAAIFSSGCMVGEASATSAAGLAAGFFSSGFAVS